MDTAQTLTNRLNQQADNELNKFTRDAAKPLFDKVGTTGHAYITQEQMNKILHGKGIQITAPQGGGKIWVPSLIEITREAVEAAATVPNRQQKVAEFVAKVNQLDAYLADLPQLEQQEAQDG